MIDYAIELERIELLDASVGGHLSWIQGTGGLDGDPKAKDQAKQLSRVPVGVAYFPPTDFLNYGKSG